MKDINLDKDLITIGRKPTNDVCIDNTAVSGNHARIIYEEGRFYIEDIESLNGTFVNKQRISKVELNDNDNIVIGKHTLAFISKKIDIDLMKPVRDGGPRDNTVRIDKEMQEGILSKTEEVLGGFKIIRGSLDRVDYKLRDKSTSIGKDKNAGIRIRSLFIPGIAAMVDRNEDGYYINPVSSKKVVQLNGETVSEQYKLNNGDTIKIAGTEMQFYIRT